MESTFAQLRSVDASIYDSVVYELDQCMIYMHLLIYSLHYLQMHSIGW